MAETLKKRSEIPEELCWDLTALFENDTACREEMARSKQAAIDFAQNYKGKLEDGDAKLILSAVKDFENLVRSLNKAGTYVNLRESTDFTDIEAVRLAAEVRMQLAPIYSTVSFFNGELARAKEESLKEASEQASEYKIFLDDIRKWQKHLLDPKTEEVLASLSPVLFAPMRLYETTKATDMKFPEFKADGEIQPLSYVLYENNYCGDTRTETRREAFRAFSETLRLYRNTTAQNYNTQVQKEKIMATERGFDSVIDFLLYGQKVPRELYDRHLDITMEVLGPVMRKWAKLLQKQYNLDEMRYSDLKLGLDPEYSPQVSVEESKEYIKKALAPMSKEYQEMVMRAFPERWVDFAQNIGKSTGGFCTSHPDAHPYILLNWNGGLSEVFTLAHELGHAAQGLLCDNNNSYMEAEFSWYDVEAPSTFHEMLLTHSLLAEAKDERFRRWVLASMIENTYYHNFVTHFIEGYYQREVYRMVDQGQSVSADDLDRIFRETLEKFWGDAVVLDEGAELTWMRQPHYYMGLYPYTYSCSLVVSTEMFQRLQKEGESAVKDWLNFLSTGGPTPPIEHCKVAGIDIEDGSALKRTLAFIEEIIDQL